MFMHATQHNPKLAAGTTAHVFFNIILQLQSVDNRKFWDTIVNQLRLRGES
jgi:hypothetical protein